MNSQDRIPGAHDSDSQASADVALKSLDATLHWLATLPAPAGLEDRVFAGMLATPRKARVLEWPQPLYTRDWMRGIAAAAIVLAVGGGGWGLYSHVKPNEPAHAIVAPRPAFQPGGFSSAEMIRRPQTLNGPPVKKAEPAESAKAKTAKVATAKTVTAKKPARTLDAHGIHAVKAQPPRTVRQGAR